MTIYELSIISTTGFPYFNKVVANAPEGVRVFLRFFDFSSDKSIDKDQLDIASKFDLKAGLVSALFEFARNIDKKIQVLEFKPKRAKNELKNSDRNHKITGEVLITTQTETFLLHKSVREKIRLIYNNFIYSKIPLDSGEDLNENEEKKIIDILTDTKARKRIKRNRNEIKRVANDFLIEMRDYGLWGISITSFDLSPIVVYGKKYSLEDVYHILRHIGYIPEIAPLDWIYRQSFYSDESVQVCIIKSDIGPTVEDILFEPYFYLLFADPQSYFGEFPAKLTSAFNNILG
ncbi:MAG: hypothetical protein ACFE9Z_09250 [Promethearchaeota archaeon]